MICSTLRSPVLHSNQTFKYFVASNHGRGLNQKVSHLFKEIPPENAMSKEQFIAEKSMTFEKFNQEYGDFARKKGMEVHEAFQKMLEGQYKNYLYHLEHVEPGRIC